MAQERRAFPRATYSLLPSDFKIKKNADLSSTFYTKVKDVSPEGVRLIVSREFSLNDNLLLTISLPTDSTPKIQFFKIPVTIIWVSEAQKSGKYEVGGKFLELSEEAQAAIRKYLKGETSAKK